MSRRLTLILAVGLALSVAVNLFAGAAAMSLMSRQQGVEREWNDRGEGRGRPSAREVVGSLSPAAQDRVRTALKAAAQRARPDFQEAHEARRQAMAAAAAESLDAAAVKTLLDRSRAAEVRGREKLEADALAIMATLNADDRRVFSAILKGRGSGRGWRGEGPPASGT